VSRETQIWGREGICVPPGCILGEEGTVDSTRFFRIRAGPAFPLLVSLLLASPVPPAHGQEYPETRAVLLEVHGGELKAFSSYQVFTRMALNESYPNIAYLFTALAVSEEIHARNMRDLLEELDVEVTEEIPSVKVSRTRKNLKHAAAVELREIDKLYPSYIKRIAPEEYPRAVAVLTHSWKAEQQHREHIEKIKVTVDAFFRSVAEKIESTEVSYHICSACGSTLGEAPQEICGICGGPVAGFRRVPEVDSLP
jgi:rubrerythrin